MEQVTVNKATLVRLQSKCREALFIVGEQSLGAGTVLRAAIHDIDSILIGDVNINPPPAGTALAAPRVSAPRRRDGTKKGRK